LRLADMLTPDGSIYFAGEPIVPAGDYYEDSVPYMWGPRLDGLSLRAMREHGWCELGFREQYFVHLLMKNGFTVRKEINHQNGRASYYVAEPSKGVVRIADGHLIDSCTKGQQWHQPEGQHVWTSARSHVPLDKCHRWSEVEFLFRNPRPFLLEVEVQSEETHRISIPAAGVKSLRMKMPTKLDEIAIVCKSFVPREHHPESTAHRVLGVAIEEIRYHKKAVSPRFSRVRSDAA